MTSKIRVPAEWEPHKAIWTCWPSAADLWEEDLEPARGEVAAMIMALITPHNGKKDVVKLLVCGEEAKQSARTALPDEVEIYDIPFGDIWLRDTGSIFAKTEEGQNIAQCFGFNGWGGKYDLEFDDEVNGKLAKAANAPANIVNFILEGGSVDGDGEGTFLTTRQCLLNPNRNTGLNEDLALDALAKSLGAEKLLWLEDGLLNDHTDGHIDNIARFIGPAKVICQSPYGEDDPNIETLNNIYNTLCSMTDAKGRKLEVIRAPSPGLVEIEEGDAIPASHMNFIIGNGAVVMPHYGTKSVDEALRVLAQCFPQHKIIGIRANAILTGGGSFHCITQQEPA